MSAALPLSKSPVRGWLEEEVYHSGDGFFIRLLEDISRAHQSVRVEVYTYEEDQLGRAMADRLAAAARRGVKVQLIVDGIGSAGLSRAFLEKLKFSGIDVRVYHPAPWQYLSVARNRWVQVARTFELLRILNKRTHRKIYLIDDVIAFVGSMNVKDCHLRSVSGKDAWRDTGLRIAGESVEILSRAFDRAWRQADDLISHKEGRPFLKRPLVDLSSRLVRLNHYRTIRKQQYRDLLSRIARAKRRVWVTNAYFVPDRSLIRSLCFAARRGADVRILVPRKSDVFFIRWVASAFYYALLCSGVKIYEYLPRILHAKTLQIDNWAAVGSSNLNHRSLMHDLEVDVVLTHAASKKSLENQFREDLKQAKRVDLKSWKERSWLERAAGRVLLLLRYWM